MSIHMENLVRGKFGTWLIRTLANLDLIQTPQLYSPTSSLPYAVSPACLTFNSQFIVRSMMIFMCAFGHCQIKCSNAFFFPPNFGVLFCCFSCASLLVCTFGNPENKTKIFYKTAHVA